MSPRVLCGMVALALSGLALTIGAVQRRASTCSAHSHAAGRVAAALAWLCVAAAAGLGYLCAVGL